MNFLFLFLILFSHPLQDEVIDNQLTLTYNGEIIETVSKDLYFHSYFSHLFVDHKHLSTLLNNLEKRLNKAPTSAYINEQDQIISEIPGKSINRERMKEQLLHALYKDHVNTIEIPMILKYPQITGELLSEISETKINEYRTYFRESNQERSHNIKLATKAINNYVVFPGKEFSFNQVVGKRTVRRGYKRAPVIVRGEFSEDVGGGICQVSSTLYNAVLLKGIQIIERYSHSREVPYVPPGRDAAVSWWGPDFVFKNTYHEPILIRASANYGNLFVQIYSSSQFSNEE